MLEEYVFVTHPLPAPGIEPLRSAGLKVNVHNGPWRNGKSDLLESARHASALLCLITDRIDSEFIRSCPNLRVIANLGSGFDNVDIDAAHEHGIVVTNTPHVLDEATADLTWALLLAGARRLPEGEELVRSGQWVGWEPSQLLGLGVHGKTLGILGLGSIGTAVAQRARGFGMRTIYHSRTRKPHVERDLALTYVDFPRLMRESDFLTVHLPLSKDTHHLVDAAALRLMKPTALVVNVGRGGVVDDTALAEALEHGQLFGAALDVYENEPQVHSKLASSQRVVLAPHLGSATTDARAEMVRLCCDNIINVLNGGHPLTPVAGTSRQG